MILQSSSSCRPGIDIQGSNPFFSFNCVERSAHFGLLHSCKQRSGVRLCSTSRVAISRGHNVKKGHKGSMKEFGIVSVMAPASSSGDGATDVEMPR